MRRRLYTPYEIELKYDLVKGLIKWLKAKEKETEANGKVQIFFVEDKNLKYGVRLHIFILSYDVGLTGDHTGITEKEWNDLTKEVKNEIENSFGVELPIYIQKWNKERKFELRYDIYIKYKELN